MNATKVEIEEINYLKLCEMRFNQYDPSGVCKKHYVNLRYTWTCHFVSWEDEDKIKNWYNTSNVFGLGNEAVHSLIVNVLDTNHEGTQHEVISQVNFESKRKQGHVVE